jgi:hypothetical protein
LVVSVHNHWLVFRCAIGCRFSIGKTQLGLSAITVDFPVFTFGARATSIAAFATTSATAAFTATFARFACRIVAVIAIVRGVFATGCGIGAAFGTRLAAFTAFVAFAATASISVAPFAALSTITTLIAGSPFRALLLTIGFAIRAACLQAEVRVHRFAF